MIPRNESAEESKGDTAATLRLSNQKKRDSGKFNTSKCLWGKYCHVMALARWYLHMCENNAKPDDILSSFWDYLGQVHVTYKDIIEN